MMKKSIFLVVGALLAVGLAIYFLSPNSAGDHVIAKSPEGETVVSVGPGGSGLGNLFTGNAPKSADVNQSRNKIETIEYRSAAGKTLARYTPNLAPNSHAYATWTSKFVVISSGVNGECPDLRVFDRATGKVADKTSPELETLTPDMQRAYDPCGIGRDEYEAWQKGQKAQPK